MTTPAFHYITVATKPHPVLDCIKQKVLQNNLINQTTEIIPETITVLGEHEDRIIGWESKTLNFGVKLREVYDFIHRSGLGANDIILFTDAYDVAYYGTKAEIIRRYLTFTKPIVFGSEHNCYPYKEAAAHYPNQDQEFPFLNSGLFIGRVWALRKCMENYQYVDEDNDQGYWTKKYFAHQDIISLDYQNLLFLNTVDIDMKLFRLDKVEDKVWYKERNPLMIHVNGPDKGLIVDLTR